MTDPAPYRRKLRVLDLFSGIGGFSLGLERTGGFETVAFCEIEKFPQKVLRKHWPDVPIFEDVRTLDATGLGRIDCITGGYPCQPFSTAGKRQGDKDDRHLWPAMLELIKTVRPAWVIGENVAGHISMGLDQVLSDLESEGYTSRPYVIPACAIDAPHRRDRVWVVAHAACQQSGPSNDGEVVSDSLRIGQQGPRRSVNASDSKAHRKGQEHRTFHDRRWPIEPAVGRVAYGVPNRVDRLKGLGNAVVPQIPEFLGYAILEAEGARP